MPAVIHLLTGPTASGKSALAMAWARTHGAEILSCDALQIYRGMDIGTAKPGADEQALARHHGLDLRNPARAFSVAEYRDYAAEVVRDIHARGKPVLVVGGSGFYLKCFFAPVADDVEISPAIKAEVAELEKSDGLDALISRLRAASPSGTGAVELRNPRRVARALERCLASGLGVPELAERFAHQGTPFDAYVKKLVRLDREIDDLKARIRERTHKMLREGLIEEVKLLAPALRANPAACSAIGYREVLDWLDGGEKTSRTELEEAITLRTVQLVKKQRTWFRTQLPGHQVVELKGSEIPGLEF
ncbi:MAG TPA: tRNA (adenosine(37)-N6)-dimethylallyltransferase MiaA [Opitutales bacterium]|jgi:tRNA dimethylallyltransferase|nr:tRNA (adenosine(37)-N6)-dimethylallyltransferase MiaA [Opitutales bacterium]